MINNIYKTILFIFKMNRSGFINTQFAPITALLDLDLNQQNAGVYKI